jgi:hypothetical protein
MLLANGLPASDTFCLLDEVARVSRVRPSGHTQHTRPGGRWRARACWATPTFHSCLPPDFRSSEASKVFSYFPFEKSRKQNIYSTKKLYLNATECDPPMCTRTDIKWICFAPLLRKFGRYMWICENMSFTSIMDFRFTARKPGNEWKFRGIPEIGGPLGRWASGVMSRVPAEATVPRWRHGFVDRDGIIGGLLLLIDTFYDTRRCGHLSKLEGKSKGALQTSTKPRDSDE